MSALDLVVDCPQCGLFNALAGQDKGNDDMNGKLFSVFSFVLAFFVIGAGNVEKTCHAPFHFHNEGTGGITGSNICHRHCQNGMSLHNSDHGQNCSTETPTAIEPDREEAAPEPEPIPAATPPKPNTQQTTTVQTATVQTNTVQSLPSSWQGPLRCSQDGGRTSCAPERTAPPPTAATPDINILILMRYIDVATHGPKGGKCYQNADQETSCPY